MNNEPVAWIDKNTGKPRMEGFIQTDYDIPLYTQPAKTLTDLITDLENVNAKQVNYIAEQKLAYEKLWKEHMELFWKHEQNKDLTNE